MIDNGEIARIEIDDSDVWPRTINFIYIEEIFDGIAFAG